ADQELVQASGIAHADHQHTGSEWVQRTGVSNAPGPKRAAHPFHDVVRGQTGRLVYYQCALQFHRSRPPPRASQRNLGLVSLCGSASAPLISSTLSLLRVLSADSASLRGPSSSDYRPLTRNPDRDNEHAALASRVR